jgi:hypothetical protein
MKVDPNKSVNTSYELVLCERGAIRCFDGSVTVMEDLDTPHLAFRELIKSLDPNKTFILALLPEEADRPVYFAARDVSQSCGVGMQAEVETPERCHALWESYCRTKQREQARKLASSAEAGGLPQEALNPAGLG